MDCDQCGAQNPVWFAPNHVWNAVMGGPSATDDPGRILCPSCFIAKAEEIGLVPSAWMLCPENAAALETLKLIADWPDCRMTRWTGLEMRSLARSILSATTRTPEPANAD